MLGGRLRLTFLLGAVVLAAALSLAACGGSDETAGTTTTSVTESPTATDTETETETTTTAEETTPVLVRVVVANGVPDGGIVRETVSKGDRVQLVVRSDVADEVHVHGYDLSRPVAPGQAARIVFVADVPGRFEVELEESGVQVADLTVRP